MASYRDKLPAAGGNPVVSVQRVTISASRVSTDAIIAPVDTQRTYIRHSASISTGIPINGYYSIELLNQTTVRVTRAEGASELEFPTISLEVVSDSSILVQRGTSATIGLITIASVNMSKSIAHANGLTVTSTGTNTYPRYSVSASLQSSTTLRLFAPLSGSNYKWEVVSYV